MTTTAKPACWRVAVLVAAAAIAASACGLTEKPYGEPSSATDTSHAAEVLKTRPSLEDSEKQLEQAVEQIAAAATSLDAGIRWQWNDQRSTLGCEKPFDQTDGQQVYLRFYLADRPISDEAWPRYQDQARTIAAAAGATGFQVVQDKPGHHDVRFFGEDGTTFSVSSQDKAVINARVGCRLPQNVRATSTSAPTPLPPTTASGPPATTQTDRVHALPDTSRESEL
ncbi:LppA family lipoprotein [Nocardia sp. CA-128927]|uniref:LppA family lipoprotein n=1 Tax=Nocardia sp. CA-128927 TaxID=3239975 RepID=UPI003D962F96